MTSPAVEAVGLSKRFGTREVLKGIDLRIAPGRVTGLVGPNAAGKSALIKIVLGLVRADLGHLAVHGETVNGKVDYRRAIGYMPQAAKFPENLTGREVLRMLRDLRGVDGGLDQELIEQFRLEPELDKPIRTLSGGTRQKLSAAVTFLFHPSLLILDEPTAGLDPVASGIFKDKVRRARDARATVLLVSHTLSELEELADDIVFLLEGRVRFHGPLASLIELTGLANLERAVASLMRENAA